MINLFYMLRAYLSLEEFLDVNVVSVCVYAHVSNPSEFFSVETLLFLCG